MLFENCLNTLFFFGGGGIASILTTTEMREIATRLKTVASRSTRVAASGCVDLDLNARRAKLCGILPPMILFGPGVQN